MFPDPIGMMFGTGGLIYNDFQPPPSDAAMYSNPINSVNYVLQPPSPQNSDFEVLDLSN
jgi:hypothetical protein